jgi:hypothetical protein
MDSALRFASAQIPVPFKEYSSSWSARSYFAQIPGCHFLYMDVIGIGIPAARTRVRLKAMSNFGCVSSHKILKGVDE